MVDKMGKKILEVEAENQRLITEHREMEEIIRQI